MDDPAFRKAYERGIRAARDDYRWHWRVHIGLWTAAHAARLEGDFVECGVNRGFLTSAIMDYSGLGFFGKTLLPARYFSRTGRTLCFICRQGLRRSGEKPEEPDFGILCPEDRRSAGELFSMEKCFSHRRVDSRNPAPDSGEEDRLSASRYELFDARDRSDPVPLGASRPGRVGASR